MTKLIDKPNNTRMVLNRLDRYAISIMPLPVLKVTQSELFDLQKQNKRDMDKLQSKFDRTKDEVEAIKRVLINMGEAEKPKHKLDHQREKLRSKQEQSLAVFQEKAQAQLFAQDVDDKLKAVNRRIAMTKAQMSLVKTEVGTADDFIEMTFSKSNQSKVSVNNQLASDKATQKD